MATTSKQSFVYPACQQESMGPCALQTSSADACSRSYVGVSSIWAGEVCKCTNGYYNRSSECWIDCYGYAATSTDYSSISLELAIVDVDCSSYSLAAESQSAFYASISRANASDYSEDAASSLTSSIAGNVSATGSSVSGIILSGSVASQGATAGLGAPSSTTEWVDRPSSTTEVQGNNGVSMKRAGGRSTMVSATVVMVLLSVFGNIGG